VLWKAMDRAASVLPGRVRRPARRFLEDHGLPRKTAEADPAGNIWLGVTGGVMTYDGSAWTHFNVLDDGLVSDKVQSFDTNAAGEVWLATFNGVSVFSGGAAQTCPADCANNDGKVDVLDLLDLGGKRDDFVNSLSRGMKQRLCLAKTLVHDPPVLILDEPASGLDPRARVEVKALLKELRKMGKTILISSHILTELADCCTSIGIIERGKLLMHGPIDDVYRRIRRNRIVRIKFIQNIEAGLSIIRSMPETRDIQIENSTVTVELDGDDEKVARLMEDLIAAGARMHSFADKEPTLEDVFMLVTKGAVA